MRVRPRPDVENNGRHAHPQELQLQNGRQQSQKHGRNEEHPKILRCSSNRIFLQRTAISREKEQVPGKVKAQGPEIEKARDDPPPFAFTQDEINIHKRPNMSRHRQSSRPSDTTARSITYPFLDFFFFFLFNYLLFSGFSSSLYLNGSESLKIYKPT